MFITDFSGGRNGVDSPVDPKFGYNQCVEAMNVDFSLGPLGRKRGGANALSLTGGTANTTGIRKLIKHIPGGNESGMELWSVDAAGTPLMKRLAAGTAWADITLADAIVVANASTVPLINGISFNGKLVLLYPSGVDRVHIWDGTRVRRQGIAVTAAPTVADQGGGAYAAVIRYYRTRSLEMNGVLIVRRSEPSAGVAFTPSGGGASARITRATAPGENETNWEIECSPDNVNWFQLVSAELGTQIAIATTTYDDTSSPSAYYSGTLTAAPILGTYTLIPSCLFGVTDGNRLVTAGNPTLTARVWLSVVLGTLNKGDDERTLNTTTTKGYIDLNEKDGGKLTGVGGPINGTILAFKYRQIWKLVPTGVVAAPYTARLMTNAAGAVNSASVVLAEDMAGNPCVYFISPRGIYRYSLVSGLEYMGRDVEDQWLGRNGKSKVNLDATMVSHAVYYPKLGQVWFYVATGASNSPNVKLVLDIKKANKRDEFGVRGGWSIHDGSSADCSTAVAFSETPGATMALQLSPYIGKQSVVKILKCDTTDLDDDGTAYQAYVKSKSLYPPEKLGTRLTVMESNIVADAVTNGTIRQTISRDFGFDDASTSDVSLTADGAETKVIRKFADGQQSDIGVVQIQLGDASVVAGPLWSMDQIQVVINEEGEI